MAKKTEDRGTVEERLFALEEAMTKVFEWVNNGNPSNGPVVLQAKECSLQFPSGTDIKTIQQYVAVISVMDGNHLPTSTFPKPTKKATGGDAYT